MISRCWRLRWPDDFRDEVLARLLELNERRHKEELLVARQAVKTEKSARPSARRKPPKPSAKKLGDAALFPSVLTREHRYVLMLLRAWGGRALTRRFLNAGMILMLDDKLRKTLLDASRRATRKGKINVVLNDLYTDLSIDGFIEHGPSAVQQSWHITATAPTTDDAPQADIDRLDEVTRYFRREEQNGKISQNEETVDAEFDFIPAGT